MTYGAAKRVGLIRDIIDYDIYEKAAGLTWVYLKIGRIKNKRLTIVGLNKMIRVDIFVFPENVDCHLKWLYPELGKFDFVLGQYTLA